MYRGNCGHNTLTVVILIIAKVLKDFQRRLAKVETHRKNKATTIQLVATFPPILSYDEWEAITEQHKRQLVEDTRNN